MMCEANPKDSIPIFDQAIKFMESFVEGQGKMELAGELVICYEKEAVALAHLDDLWRHHIA